MAIISDTDIRKLLDSDIVIHPFDENSLTPIGYDFRVGEFVFSLEKGLIQPSDGIYHIPPKSIVQILTKESLWISNNIGGTLHSMVSIVSKGLSHISTTLDPGWFGPLLITMRNNRNTVVDIKIGDSFVTLVLFKLSSPVKNTNRDFSFIERILLQQLQGQTDEYISSLTNILGDSASKDEFRRKIEMANSGMSSRILNTIRNSNLQQKKYLLGTWIIYLIIISLIALPFYWDKISKAVGNITYDSQVFVGQIAAIIAMFSMLQSRKKNNN